MASGSSERSAAKSPEVVAVPSWMAYFENGHVFTVESNASGSPAMNDFDAWRGLMSAARAFA